MDLKLNMFKQILTVIFADQLEVLLWHHQYIKINNSINSMLPSVIKDRIQRAPQLSLDLEVKVSKLTVAQLTAISDLYLLSS